MKEYEKFLKTLDADFFTVIENELATNSVFLNAPNETVKRHTETAIITTLILAKYHEWQNEEN